MNNDSHYYQCWKQFVLINIFVKIMLHFFQDSLWIESSKGHFLEIEIFCYIMSLLLPIDKINASLLNNFDFSNNTYPNFRIAHDCFHKNITCILIFHNITV